MSDEEDYNSEEDADYVPSDGEVGSEEEHSGEEEDLTTLADGESNEIPQNGKRKSRGKKPKQDLVPRKRKGGIKLEGEEAAPEENNDSENLELAEQVKEEARMKKEENEKKRVDDLWSSFMSDVKMPPRRAPPPSSTSLASSATSKAPSVQKPSEKVPENNTPKTNGSKMTITQVFDFAGEEIKVTKEVDVNSKEAKAELKKQQQSEEDTAVSSSGSSSTPSSAAATTTTPTTGLSALGLKRPAPSGGGLSGVLGKIGKKQKMGTLEKSKLDWDSFKKKEGIEEDLQIHNKGKDGYIERMNFLNRTDVRQYEIERDMRLSKSGKR